MRLPNRLPALMAAALSLSAPAAAENIDLLMTGLFPSADATYIGYDSVERLDIPESAPIDRKYLIVDFRFHSPMATDQLQASVHKVCMTLLKDHELIQSLSNDGYDMVSVAFDRQSQYDCL
ncbi:MAG: hypothetical protein R3175_03825 [Marinobacter sp.]|uniref:hypothetical protein n=1 Tax=Marinobacter sp. TaxID=50741 RepID=UPI00299D04E7|nr:hypothetical protein [Marinobacter sp.]MDX1755168.1 hypothetical protein [Marinobacter sp.]